MNQNSDQGITSSEDNRVTEAARRMNEVPPEDRDVHYGTLLSNLLTQVEGCYLESKSENGYKGWDLQALDELRPSINSLLLEAHVYFLFNRPGASS
jgi:hypothetical protein